MFLGSTLIFIRMNPKETALARKKGIQFALFLPLAGLEVPSGPDGRLKGSGAASLMVSPVWGGRGWSRSGDNPSHHFCVCQLKLQRQPKGGLICFCVYIYTFQPMLPCKNEILGFSELADIHLC